MYDEREVKCQERGVELTEIDLRTPVEKQAVHCQLADYFEQQATNARIADELPYQLEQAGEKQRLLV